MQPRRLVGVLGGMGPMATVDFMRKVIEMTPAGVDQDHVPMIVHCVPQIPDRVSAILERRDDPLAALIAGAEKLVDAGAEVIAMPCHTAHAWFTPLARSVRVPILHIAEAALGDLDKLAQQPRRIALLGTLGTLRAGIYQDMLAKHGRDLHVPDEGTQACILSAIAAVKRNDLTNARTDANEALRRLVEAQCDAALLACTELPLAIDAQQSPLHLIDPTNSLAKACVEFSLKARSL
jgi:aspartate racemase